jgi:hypothetical protein
MPRPHHRIDTPELLHAQTALLVAIALQVFVWYINDRLAIGPQYLIIPTELFLSIVIGTTANLHTGRARHWYHVMSLVLPALITAANLSSLGAVLSALILGHDFISGQELLASAIAIFATNIIVFALWYWEIDSPGLTRTHSLTRDRDFQFTQQDMPHDFPEWQPRFLDYLYVSMTNAINFAPADTRPLSQGAKLLMGTQSLISVFTLALVLARSVSILGVSS